MELYKEILVRILKSDEVNVTFPQFEGSCDDAVEMRCYKALCEIKEILADSTLDDKECFWKIEKIVRVFEKLGSDSGGRHDF